MALNRIEVHFINSLYDIQGKQILNEIRDDLQINSVDKICSAHVYLLDGDLTRKDLDILGRELFTDPVIQYFACNETPIDDFSYIVEVGYKPGVTDNTAQTAAEGIIDILGKNVHVYTVRQYTFSGSVVREEIEAVCKRILYNPTIEYYSIRENKKYIY